MLRSLHNSLLAPGVLSLIPNRADNSLRGAFSRFPLRRPSKTCLMNGPPSLLTYSHIKQFMARGKQREEKRNASLRVMMYNPILRMSGASERAVTSGGGRAPADACVNLQSSASAHEPGRRVGLHVQVRGRAPTLPTCGCCFAPLVREVNCQEGGERE